MAMDLAADAAQVISIIAALRWFWPKIDGWFVVGAVLLASAGVAIHANAPLFADGVSLGDCLDASERAVLVFMSAFGGWNAIKKMLREARPPELVGEFISMPGTVSDTEVIR